MPSVLSLQFIFTPGVARSAAWQARTDARDVCYDIVLAITCTTKMRSLLATDMVIGRVDLHPSLNATDMSQKGASQLEALVAEPITRDRVGNAVMSGPHPPRGFLRIARIHPHEAERNTARAMPVGG